MKTHLFKEKLTILKHYLLQQLHLLVNRHGLRDKILILSLVLGFFAGVQGFTWGRYDCLNLDKMAFQSVFDKNRLPFQPARYVKPPFYTYLNHFVARIPAMTVSSMFFWKKSHERYEIFLVVRTWIARALNLVMFAACTTGIFILLRKYYNLESARVAALLFATSAGFVPYQIFLTTDLAVIFMMLASFLFAVRILNNPGMGNSIAAGLLAGLATATKYNGLAVAIALPLAHLLACRSGNPLMEVIKRKSAWVCGACVPLGFLLGNPYTIFDWQKFRADFIYNYTVTPVYNGATSGNGYRRFFESFYEIFGVPGTFFLGLALVLGLGFVLINLKTNKAWQLWIMAGAVFALYTYKIGAFPRIETRFVLPAAPFLLIMASAGFVFLLKARFVSISLLVVILAYNLACCWWTGRLFANDPRNYVPEFTKQKLQNGGIVEWSKSNPKLEALPVKLTIHQIHTGLERSAMFDKMFADNPDIHAMVKTKEVQVTPEWFSVKSRKSRNTDYIIWSTIDLEGIVRHHYEALFDESSGYRVAYDARSPKQPDWVYPKRTEFTRNRTTIWEKIPAS